MRSPTGQRHRVDSNHPGRRSRRGCDQLKLLTGGVQRGGEEEDYFELFWWVLRSSEICFVSVLFIRIYWQLLGRQ